MIFPTMGLPIEFKPFKSAISTAAEPDIVIVMDRSGSMTFPIDQNSDRLPYAPGFLPGMPAPLVPDARKAATSISSFLDVIDQSPHDEHVGLCTYSELGLNEVPLGNRTDAARTAIALHTQSYIGTFTNIGGGILAGVDCLSDTRTARPWATRVLILVTDGKHNIGTDPISAASQAASQNIMIFTVTYSDEADQESMKQVASIGRGFHIHAADGDELRQAFKHILVNLPNLITY
ncbi:MAG: vWA domain-containing protein [Pirellulales bacterium]